MHFATKLSFFTVPFYIDKHLSGNYNKAVSRHSTGGACLCDFIIERSNNIMKKAIALVMAACLAFSLVACGGASSSTATSTSTASSTAASSEAASSEAASSEAAATEAGVKTGMAIVSNTTVADADADAAGNAQVDSTAAAVLVGEDGKIISCKLDVAQNKVPVNADGSFDTTATFKSKQELKEEYNMKGASPIGKEWYEQANAFAEYVVGMTAEEVRAIETNPDAHNGPVDADIAASCTMSVTDFIEAIAQATENAQVLGASADDTLALGLSTNMDSSKLPADNEGEGLVQTDTTYAAVTTDADGKITSSIWDCTQAKFDVTEAGEVTSKGDIVSKQDLKEEYNMKGASGIGKEWYEQANAYAAWLVGKTAADVAAVETDAEGHNGPTDADIAASCTMNVLDFNAAVEKALA